MKGRHELLELTQPEVEAILRRSGLALLPTGSVEQHGPHLPCGTDYLASLVIGRQVAERLDALLLPFAPMGVTPFHMSFAGTITLRPETYMALFEDVCESAIQHGARRLAVINWHEGNTASINLAAAAVRRRHPVQMAVVQACWVAYELYGQECGLTHGGELEVLPILAYDPSLVALERATNPSPMEPARRMDALRRRRTAYPIIADVRELYPTGWYGEPQRATPEKAKEFLDRVSERVAELIRETLAAVEGPTS
ncbi:MAG: creatininase family protein [Deltaproteobacteria bacterium]|nr:creatininase family protein [Deltaproteobacteria bacterium]MBI3078889.1 creatininase family protein [Deltaproteobacteria bacterium]